ncbi:MAG: hypothetical protein ACI4AD_10610 [Roseburia sp.]
MAEKKKNYEIMHGEKITAFISIDGSCEIVNEKFLPYSLYLENTKTRNLSPEEEMDVRISNITNFYFWCASRVLTLDRIYAKEILNSIGALQAQTDRERAQIALSYHCMSMTDIYWVREKGEQITFSEINLFEHHLDNALVDISLRGKQMTVQNSHLIADDLSTNGVFPKAWVRIGDRFLLLKDGGEDAVDREILASRICQCFDCRQVVYREAVFDGQKVSESEIITSLDYSIVSREYFEIYAVNHEIDAMKFILKLDGYSYYMMNILDYLIGNTDRHWGNWGLLVDNRTNEPVRLYDLMDFNQAFGRYDTIEGANCLTTDRKNLKMTQQEAAEIAVRKVGLNQIREVDREWFAGLNVEYEMYKKRYEYLKNV